RDTRSGLALIIRNRGARMLSRPVLELDLPAGVELDEAARDQLARRGLGPPSLEGRTLRLRLPPLPPGARLHLPLPFRWTLGGSLRGLGAVIRDEGFAPTEAERRAAILPSRLLEIPDEGPEPEPHSIEEGLEEPAAPAPWLPLLPPVSALPSSPALRWAARLEPHSEVLR
ncbi:MAG: hypothetical protein OEY14_18630, partial [Myxococcales bacterium]|nr:hypothetical protein [Myxococcales bacterium]